MIKIEKCIAEIEFRFPYIATHPTSKEAWQTLKSFVLTKQKNNSCDLGSLLEKFWHEFPDEYRYCSTESLTRFAQWAQKKLDDN